MKERISKLLQIKSIVTIVLTGGFTYLAVIGSITAAEFVAVYTMIIGFYFGTQKKDENNENNSK